MGHSTEMKDAGARTALKDDLARFNCKVHQPDDPPLFSREPKTKLQPMHWRWADLEPLLDRLGKSIEIGSGGQRRTLRLANPGVAYGTTHTFWASIQYILPGEIAEAHRHTANAFRFIMQGHGATTTVEGERYPMNEGDLVLTPGWLWHDHEHHGDKPMVWLDVLDISLMQMMQGTFFDPYNAPTQPIADIQDRSYRQYSSGLMRSPYATTPPAVNPLLVYSREMAIEALDLAAGLEADPYDDVVREYQNPTNGASAMTTMAMTLQRLRNGFKGLARRHTGSKLYYVVEGSGSTILDDQTFNWSTGDFMMIPPWTWHRHEMPDTGKDATLFQVNDTPAMKALGFYREDRRSNAAE